MIIALTEAQNEMLVVHDAWHRDGLHFTREKKRRGIPVAEWLEHLVPLKKISIEVGKRQLVIKAQTRLQRFIRQKLTCHATKRLRERIDIFFKNR